jgi:di/tricarboxylate transporter
VMSPGGYNFRDFFKIGFPLTVILFVLVMLILPSVWSL